MQPAFSDLIQSELPVLIDFYAEWCGPCKAIEPEMARLSRDMRDKVTIIKIDVEKYLQEALHYEVRGVPTFVLIKDGQVIWKEAGVLNYQQLHQILSEYI